MHEWKTPRVVATFYPKLRFIRHRNIQPRSQAPPSFLLLAVLIAMKNWAGPENEARKHPLHAHRLEFKFHILKEIKDNIYTYMYTYLFL